MSPPPDGRPDAERSFLRPDDSKLEVLLGDRGRPVSVSTYTPLTDAIKQMLANSYSQLPVIDNEQRPIGLITQQDILRLFHYSDQLPPRLTVRDAMVAIASDSPLLVHSTTSIWMVLDRFGSRPALLVTDGSGRLVGIVTDYDTSSWLRLRSADTVAVQDIEQTLRDLITDAYLRTPDASLDADIERMARDMWDSHTGSKIKSAIGLYSEQSVDPKRLASVLEQIASKTRMPKGLEDLTFAQYARLLLSAVAWARYAPHSGFDKDSLNDHLARINAIRNDIAHLRGVGDAEAREQLQWFKRWLNNVLVPLLDEASPDDCPPGPSPPEGDSGETNSVDGVSVGDDVVQSDDRPDARAEDDAPIGHAPIDDAPNGEDANHDSAASLGALTAWLKSQRQEDGERVTLSFDKIDDLLGESLPAEAREHRMWWSNGAPHADAWLDAGYSVVGFFVGVQKVRFGKDRLRERQYLDFYKMLAERFAAAVPKVKLDPRAYSWQRYDRVTAQCGNSFDLILAFTRSRRFRMHAEIDVGDAERNIKIFRALEAHRAEIEERVGAALIWRPAEDHRVCQISLYAPGEHHITDPFDKLSELADWVTQYIGSFTEAMHEYVPRA